MSKTGPSADLSSFNSLEKDFLTSFISLQSNFDKWKDNSREVLRGLISRGGLFGKALPGRAVMLISSLAIDQTEMPVVFEQPKSPKVGNYVPSTNIQILSDDVLLEHNPKTLIVWSWHIVDEIVAYLDSMVMATPFHIANLAATANVLNVSGGSALVLPAGAVVTEELS